MGYYAGFLKELGYKTALLASKNGRPSLIIAYQQGK